MRPQPDTPREETYSVGRKSQATQDVLDDARVGDDDLQSTQTSMVSPQSKVAKVSDVRLAGAVASVTGQPLTLRRMLW